MPTSLAPPVYQTHFAGIAVQRSITIDHSWGDGSSARVGILPGIRHSGGFRKCPESCRIKPMGWGSVVGLHRLELWTFWV